MVSAVEGAAMAPDAVTYYDMATDPSDGSAGSDVNDIDNVYKQLGFLEHYTFDAHDVPVAAWDDVRDAVSDDGGPEDGGAGELEHMYEENWANHMVKKNQRDPGDNDLSSREITFLRKTAVQSSPENWLIFIELKNKILTFLVFMCSSRILMASVYVYLRLRTIWTQSV